MKASALGLVGWRHTGSQRYALLACVCVFGLAPLGALALGTALSGSLAPPAEAAMVIDEDGVQMLYPSAPGSWYRLGAQDPNRAPGFTIEHQTPATARVEGALHYWNVPSYALTYASGGSGWTSRLHLYASGGHQRYTWKTQHGYLASPAVVAASALLGFMAPPSVLGLAWEPDAYGA